MAYISRPKITPDYVTKQLTKKSTNSQVQKETTGMVAEVADDSVRHPVTQRFTRQYQNHQTGGVSMDKPSKDSK